MYTKKGGIVMGGKTVEYPKEFKMKAVKAYLSGNHGRLYKGSTDVWYE
jgi:hypothetical protein